MKRLYDFDGSSIPPSKYNFDEDHEQAARFFVEQLPDEWDEVNVQPRYEAPKGYIGMGFAFVRDGRYVSFVADPTYVAWHQDRFLGKVRALFEKAEADATRI